ncbi:uncharacterized protein LOC144629619 [Oculina patagonica]
MDRWCLLVLMGFVYFSSQSRTHATDESQCDKADWVESLDRAGWSKCPQTNTYLKGLWRNDRKEGDERVGRIEYGRCCQASEEAFANQPAVCNNANWRITLDGSNVWALCPGGYFLNGLRKSDGGNLHNIEEGQCCRPQNQLEDDYDECYDEDVGTSFDNGGWSECQRAGYYMTGIYKSSCDEIYCIEKFKCCRMKTLTVETGTEVPSVSNGCARLSLGEGNTENVIIPQLSWIQTPSVLEIEAGHYRAFGRVIHLQYLQERLTTQNGLNFDATRQTMDLVDQMDILADTVYIEGNVLLHGIRNVKIYAREIIASPGSRIDFSAPNWNQVYQLRVVTGSDGEDGKHGTSGPQVEIFCDVINGALEVISNGGDGHKGQDGGNGAVAQDSHDRRPDKPASICYEGWRDRRSCNPYSGERGVRGPTGGRGRNAGQPGNGGNAGRINIRYRNITGTVQLNSCPGSGAPAATNGRGGMGGAGGAGGKGRYCRIQSTMISTSCMNYGATDRAPNGPRGHTGPSGSSAIRGTMV